MPALFAVVYAAPFAVIIGGVVWFLGLAVVVAMALPFGIRRRRYFWPVWVALWAGLVGGGLSLAGFTGSLFPWAQGFAFGAELAVALLYGVFGAISGTVLQRRLV